MSLTSALNTSLTGLKVAQEGITVSSNNVANVATPGYIRQSIEQSAVVQGGIGQGAQIDGIVAEVDKQLLKSIQNQTSDAGKANALSYYYDKAQRLFGQPNSNNTLANQIDEYFSSFQRLSDNPETISLRLSSVNSAETIASKMSSIATGLQQLRLDADKEIHSTINTINTLIDRIASSNANISTYPEGTTGRLDVEQRREVDLRKLSEYIDITSTVDENGGISVLTKSGAPLIESANTYHLDHTTAASLENFINDLAMTAITVRAVNSDGTLDAPIATIATAGKSDTITANLQSGSLKGLLQLRDRDLPVLLDQIDTLANAFTERVNAIHNDGVAFPPPSQLTGTRPIKAEDSVGFSGKVMIAVLNSNGTPANSPYGDETGFRPLTLDLSKLDSGDGAGYPTMQTIIDEINTYFGPPQPRASVGNLRDIQLAAISNNISDAGTAQFDLQLDNISTQGSTVVINSITVVDPNDLTQTYNAATLPNPNTYTIDAGNRERTSIPFTVDFGGDDNRTSYTVRLNVSVTDDDGNVSTATIDYTIPDNQTDIINKRYSADAVTNIAGDSAYYIAPSSQGYAVASLVNASGYPASAGEEGFLKITTNSGQNYGIAIDELNSQEIGLPSTASSDVTNRGFSHYFELNNLFVRNEDGAVSGSAINMAVRSDISANTGLLARGELFLSNQPSDTDSALYTYELGSGNNTNVQRMASLGTDDIDFPSNESMPSTTTSFSGYTANVVSYVSTQALNKANDKEAEALGLQGLSDLLQKSAGVNTDDELANVINLQNNYAASAKILAVIRELFRALEGAF
ncbi:MAG: flgK [Rickettsiaceae bacterium]|jgi:flagellar hook-associated protein 1 FlgK|nr:flgK [Rickettsiaceae bacterium]